MKHIFIYINLWMHTSCCCRCCFMHTRFCHFSNRTPNSIIMVSKKPFCAAPLPPPRLALEFCPMASLENTWISSSLLSLGHFWTWDLFCNVWALIVGKLYRALWRTCGMFSTSKRCFTSGTSLSERKGCIEAWWSSLFDGACSAEAF